ncbi:TPA: TPM domain-containing protein [Escherichia coli]|nr:TPM domain-containing protein [Escherichia coli]
MKKFIILLSLLILLPLTAICNSLIPVMNTLFTDVTGTVPDAEAITRKAELFRQQTGVAPFIVVLPDINNEASLRQNGKAMLAHAASSMSNVKGSVLLLFTTREPRLIMITNGQVESSLDDKHLGLLVENHTLAYLHADLWYQGINNALDVLQAQILKQPTPPLTYYPHPGQQHENAPPGSTTTSGIIAWAVTFVLFSRGFHYTTRFIYALKFAVAMTVANVGYQALCLYIDNSFAITRISPLWAGLIGVCTFIAALLWTSRRKRRKRTT